MRVIINADDCGYDKRIDSHIKDAIEKGKISSTTIMANMDDLEGALSLYETYHNDISFGVHLNLTEGCPLLESSVLIDYGLYSMKDGKAYFDGIRANNLRYKFLPSAVKQAIYNELTAQITKLRQEGVAISHIDSHHHIHTSPSLIGVTAQLSKDFNIHKTRRMRNYVPMGLSFSGRQLWALLSKINNKNYQFTKFFAAVYEFFEDPSLYNLKEKDTIELMCHPGNQGDEFQKEMNLLMGLTFPDNMKLITYNDL